MFMLEFVKKMIFDVIILRNNYLKHSEEQNMNVLHIEEMIEAEKRLISTEIRSDYRINLPNSDEISLLQNRLFGVCGPNVRQQLEKRLTVTKSLKSLKLSCENSTVKLFAYAVLAIIYPSASHKDIPVNNLLLQTFKCTLYSTDVNLNMVINTGFDLDNLQAKAMIARYLDVLSSERKRLNMSKIDYLEYSLQCNPRIFQILVVFYRFILFKLGIEGAENYKKEISFEETVVNLAEYFDIGYRNFSYMFMFYEENIFLAKANDEVILGEYGENVQDYKEISFKDSKQFNEMQYFLLRSSDKMGKRSKIEGHEQEAKLFNFLLESADLKNLKGQLERSQDFQTPHFAESHQFIFGRKKRESGAIFIQDEIKKIRMTLNSSIDSLKDFNFNECMALLKSLDDKQNALQLDNEQNKISLVCTQESKCSLENAKDIYDSPIKEMDQGLYQSQISVEGNCAKKSSESIEFINNQTRVEEDKTEALSSSNCKCRQYRLTRSNLTSQTVNFTYFPPQKPKYILKAPSFFGNLTGSQKIVYNTKQIPQKLKRLGTLQEKTIEEVKQSRKPAFLKCLKKNRERSQQGESSAQKQKKSINNSEIARQKLQFQQNKSFTFKKEVLKGRKFSAVVNIPHFDTTSKEKPFRQTYRTQCTYNSSKKKCGQNLILKKFDINNIHARPTLGSNCQSATNFHQNSQTIITRKPTMQISNHPLPTKDEKLTVRITPPPFCFNSNAQQNSRISFKTKSFTQQQRLKDIKQSQRILRTQPPIPLLKSSS